VKHLGRRETRQYVDFASVPETQWEMHDRLQNWAKWCHSPPGHNVAPMFGLYRSEANAKREYGSATPIPLDRMDALELAKAVVALPDKHRRALQWHYLKPRKPIHMAHELGVSLDGLAELVILARTMLRNRGV
jgi:DNA-directed RNA polymerase specialized sigma24 family protein